MDLIVSDNACGECNACCEFCDIDVLDKPSGTLCSHYDNGCSIYEDRPLACSSYQCMWHYQDSLGNKLPEKYRPDHLGVIFEKPYKADFWVAVEIKAGSIDTQECFSMIKAIERENSALLIKRNNGMVQHHLPETMTLEDFNVMYKKYIGG